MPRKNIVAAVSIAALIALFGTNAWLAVRTKCATADEPLHAMGAFMKLHYGDHRIDSRDPPLWQYWATLATPKSMLNVDLASAAWRKTPAEHWHDWEWSVATLYRTPGNDADAVLSRMRFMMLLAAMAGVTLCAVWAWQAGGPVAGVITTALLSFDPNLLAHAPLMKNDVAVSFALVWVAYATWRVQRKITFWSVSQLLLAVAVCVNVKFSGLLCLGMLPLLLLIDSSLPRLKHGLKTRATILVMVLFVSYLAIWAAYGFRFRSSSEDALRMGPIVDLVAQRELRLQHPDRAPTHAELHQWKPPMFVRAMLFAHAHRLLPESFVHGLLYTYQSTISYPAFCLNQYSDRGWWYYFPLAIACKTPLSTLALIIIALTVARVFNPCIVLTTPVILYSATALSTNTNLGIRHILPIFPFIYIACGIVLARAMSPRWIRIATPALLLALAVESLSSFPHYIPFFNLASRSHQLDLLSDSNLDWGQDLPLLKQWQKKHPHENLYLCYFGMADPSYYGIRYKALPGSFQLDGQPPIESPTQPGVIAISATHLQGTFLPPDLRRQYAEFRQRKPLAILGHTIYLYRYPQ